MYIGKTFEETGCRQMAATQCGNDTLSWRPTAVTYHSLTGSCVTPVTVITQNTVTEDPTITTFNL